jgi:GTPase SAR1 family protein
MVGLASKRTLGDANYRNSKIVVLVFSVTDANAIADLRCWVEEIRKWVDEMPSLIVVTNKTDLEEKRVLSSEEAQGVAGELEAPYFEVSAKTGQGIEDLFVRPGEEAIGNQFLISKSQAHGK